jgi:hypothetical protein
MLKQDVPARAGRTPPPMAGPGPSGYLGADDVIPVLAALRGSDDVLELCRTGLPAAPDSSGPAGSS